MVVGPLEANLAQDRREALRTATDIAGVLAAGARQERSLVVADIGVELALDEACRHPQSHATRPGLERLEL
jgi:hypothetical protein